MNLPIRNNPFVRPTFDVLEPGVVRTCQVLQRKGFTLTEIAERLQIDRDYVAYELYWKDEVK